MLEINPVLFNTNDIVSFIVMNNKDIILTNTYLIMFFSLSLVLHKKKSLLKKIKNWIKKKFNETKEKTKKFYENIKKYIKEISTNTKAFKIFIIVYAIICGSASTIIAKFNVLLKVWWVSYYFCILIGILCFYNNFSQYLKKLYRIAAVKIIVDWFSSSIILKILLGCYKYFLSIYNSKLFKRIRYFIFFFFVICLLVNQIFLTWACFDDINNITLYLFGQKLPDDFVWWIEKFVDDVAKPLLIRLHQWYYPDAWFDESNCP